MNVDREYIEQNLIDSDWYVDNYIAQANWKLFIFKGYTMRDDSFYISLGLDGDSSITIRAEYELDGDTLFIGEVHTWDKLKVILSCLNYEKLAQKYTKGS